MSARADLRDPDPRAEPGDDHHASRPSAIRRLFDAAAAAAAGTSATPPFRGPARSTRTLPSPETSFTVDPARISVTTATTAPSATSAAEPSLEAELAGRLDAVLGIAERLAASHDREDLFRTIVDETRRALHVDYVTIRILKDDELVVAAWAGLTGDVARSLPVVSVADGWVGELLRTGRAAAVGSDLVAPLLHHDRVIGALTAVTYEPRAWTAGDIAFLTTLATHAGIALTNAELFERTEARAAQLGALQAASGRLSRASSIQAVGRTVVEETRRIIDYHNARVYLIEGDQVVPIAFEGRVGAYEQVDLDLLRCQLGEGFTGWVGLHGEALLINDANGDPRGSTIAGTEDVDESMLVVPMRYDGVTVGVITLSKLGLDGFDADDLRVLTILADQAATAAESARLLTRTQDLARELRRLLDMSGELSASLDPRQVANLMARHLASAMTVDECAISYWDRGSGRVESLGYWPALRIDQLEPFFDVSGFPETLRALEMQETVIIDTAEEGADPAEVALLERDGNRMLVMHPLIAKGQSIALVELMSRVPVQWTDERLELARTMANEAAMALENARLYEDARKLADRDPLTGFYNHRFLHERLGEEVVRSQRARRQTSVLMLDLDDFKLVNDTFGHLFGDRVLTFTAELIRSTLRASDIAARYGGDEFAVILPETDAAEARRTAERILEAFRDRPFIGEQRGPVPVAVSIGVATFPDDGRTATELIAAADAALYTVKRAGGHAVATSEDGAAA
jgi:diguanylate cyclase (GGDEF)-like protein